MNHVPNRQRPRMQQMRKLSTHGLPLVMTLLLAACGGGDSDSPSTAQRAMAGLSKMMGIAGAGQEVALTPVNAFASSLERGDLVAAAAIDGNDGTRWGSGHTDNESLTLDFGKSETINRVRINWENAHAVKYLLQVSEDKDTWTTIKTIDNSQGGVEDIAGLNGQGRYLRVQGVTRSTAYGYSIFEIKAFSGSEVTPPPPPPDPDPGQNPDPNQPPVDPTKPGVAVKPVKATSSETENGGLSAANAIDGNAATRWASKSENGAYIDFDFGVKTQIGYMKLVWENSYGKAYELRVSDDGQNWSKVRYVGNGKGGTEEFYNLGINARYVRMQGETRATNYGYSLFEVEFKTPGSDNSLVTGETSALKFPASGAGFIPLPTQADPIEQITFTLADGTMVTRVGLRGLNRHGRERGEDWAVGDPNGKNETIDPVTGAAVDKGPGAYLDFVPNYFKNRTWGFEIIDNSRVAGVTAPVLKVNEYFGHINYAGGTAFIRATDRVGVTGYGWMNNGSLYKDKGQFQECAATPYPVANKLSGPNGINSDCTILVKDFPGHQDVDAEGYPNGVNIPARPLQVGDSIEMSPSLFAPYGVGDNGGNRYYSSDFLYVMGEGVRPWYGTFPRLNSTKLPASSLTGGLGSVSYDYADNGNWIFQQPMTNIGMQNMQRFVEGRRLIHTNFLTGNHNEPGNDRYDAAVGLQGQRYNQSACIACHVNNGRSPAPFAANQKLDTMSVRVAVTGADGKQLPHPMYGTSVQMNASSTTGVPQNWGTGVNVEGFVSSKVALADGTEVELRKPTVKFEGPTPEVYSLRSAQPMLGMGLLEAIPEADILARVRTSPDADGVKGLANYAFDPESGTVRLGRFGWKAAKSSLRHQSAEALLLDMSVTSTAFPNRICATNPAACASAPKQKGITDSDLDSIAQYLALVAVPAQRNLESAFPKGVAPLPDLIVDVPKVNAGAKVFEGMKCAACHTAEMKTGSGSKFAELRNQTIRPYSDLLLHDMGPGLDDKFVEGQAKGSYWRTSPLWGIGYTEKILDKKGQVGYLHDGRARNLTEAIMWHGGEATASRQRFQNLSKTDRDALLAFLRSL